jgi:hypothetical protein
LIVEGGSGRGDLLTVEESIEDLLGIGGSLLGHIIAATP